MMKPVSDPSIHQCLLVTFATCFILVSFNPAVIMHADVHCLHWSCHVYAYILSCVTWMLNWCSWT